jgi:hypothetical protein
MERYLWDLVVLSVRTLFWIARTIVGLSPWLMDALYGYIVFPLLGQERTLRMGRAAIIVQCIVIQVLIWGGLLALLFGGDLSVAFWGVVVGVWAGIRAGSEVANSLDYVRSQIEMEEPPVPAPMEEMWVQGQSGPLDLSIFEAMVAAEADEAQPVPMDEER